MRPAASRCSRSRPKKETGLNRFCRQQRGRPSISLSSRIQRPAAQARPTLRSVVLSQGRASRKEPSSQIGQARPPNTVATIFFRCTSGPVVVDGSMNLHSPPAAAAFTAAERDLIPREFGQHFSSYPSLAEGMFLRIWHDGPHAGQPKLPPAVRTMIGRGLIEVRMNGRTAKALFTAAGLDALRELATIRRYLDPICYAHVRRELGLEAEEGGTPIETPLPSTEGTS
jgi:hypothetical protein